jgi:hypothetical protein
MPAPLPVSFRASPLVSDFRGSPQQLQDAIVARLSLETQEALALFGGGSTLPTSDQGPFFLDWNKLYVWDSGTSSYVPQTIEFKPSLNTKPFRANSSGAQTIVFAAPGASSVDLVLTEEFDPDGVFASNTFTAPENGFYQIKAKCSVAATSGTPTDNLVLFFLKKNGFQMAKETVFQELGNVYLGRTYSIDTLIQLAAGDTIKATVGIEIGGGTATWTIAQNDTWMAGSKVRNLVF